jgi:hypothetical protein
MVERAKVLFPLSQIGAITEGQRLDIIKQSGIYGKYDNAVERESAFETLMAEAENLSPTLPQGEGDKPSREPEDTAAEEQQGTAKSKKSSGIVGKVMKAIMTAITSTLAAIVGSYVSNKVSGKKSRTRTSAKEKVVKNATSAATRTITRELTRDILGNLIK